MPLNYILLVQLGVLCQYLMYQTPAQQGESVITSSYSPSLAFREIAGNHTPVSEEAG